MAKRTKARTRKPGSRITVTIRIRLSQKAVWLTTGFLAGVWVASFRRLLGAVNALGGGN